MTPRRSSADSVRAVSALVAAALGVSGCHPAPSHEPSPAIHHLTPTSLPTVAPIAFFENACANCHGPFGMFYGEEFARGRDDAALTKVVRDMVTGPARTKLDELSLSALVSFHRALREPSAGPFLIITSRTSDTLAGEVTPGSTVSVIVDEHAFTAEVDGFAWSARLPVRPDTASHMKVIATSNAARTTIDPSVAVFSHVATNH